MTLPFEPQKARWWYDHIIDWLLAHPEGSYKECAQALGRSPNYISMLMGSSMFEMRLKERRVALNGRLDDAIVQRTKAAANKSLELLLHRLEKDPDKVTTGQALNIAEKTLAAAGYGPRNLVGNPPPQNITVQANVTVSREVLADARARIRARETLDLSATEIERSEAKEPPLRLEERTDSGEGSGELNPLRGGSAE